MGQVTSTNMITFTKDELTPEGTGKSLHIAVECPGMIISRVLIDNGSALNYLPFDDPIKNWY